MSEGVSTDSTIVTTENTGPESTQTVETGSTEVTTTETGEDAPTGEPETFTREYVTELRKENAGYRLRAKETAERLHLELVKATGLLADPTDLAFNEDHLSDPDALAAAVQNLIEAKPHLRARKVTGDAGQGPRGSTDTSVNLLSLLRGDR